MTESVLTAALVLSFCLLATVIITRVLTYVFVQRRQRNKLRQRFIMNFKNREEFRYLVFLIFCGKEEMLIRDMVYPELSEMFKDLTDANFELVCAGYTDYRLG